MQVPSSLTIITIMATLVATVHAVPIQQMENNQWDYILSTPGQPDIISTSVKA